MKTPMTKKTKMKSLMVLALMAAVPLTSGCATVKGFGRDVESVGEAGSKAIDGD